MDIIIPYHSKDCDTIGLCIKGCLANICGIGKIYIISNSDPCIPNTLFVNENEIFDVLNFNYVQEKLIKKSRDYSKRSGWLFQQLIKIGCFQYIKGLSEIFLILDSDVIFQKKVLFEKNEKLLISKSDEYFPPYFDFYRELLGEEAEREYSFITHHMPITQSILASLITKIETKHEKKWYDAIIDIFDIENGLQFSEYETIGNFIKKYYVDKFEVRKLKNVQSFKVKDLLKVYMKWPHYITIHNYKKPENNVKTNKAIYDLIFKSVHA